MTTLTASSTDRESSPETPATTNFPTDDENAVEISGGAGIDTIADNHNTNGFCSEVSLVTKKELNHSNNRIADIIKEGGDDLVIEITEASKSNDVHGHNLQGFIVYFIKFGIISVKRRYSEFESLRTCLIKQFPTLIIPPIPEKQSLKSNIAFTTSNSLGFATSTFSNNISDHNKNETHSSNGLSSNSIDSEHKDDGFLRRYESDPIINLVDYRKRMLSEFLNKCMKIKLLVKSKFFLHFLDPEINFMDYVNDNENHTFYKTSIFQLSPIDPLNNLENQLYLTLPIPLSSDSHLFKELADEEQFQKFVSFETKFIKYEMVLNNITKINKRILKNISSLSNDLSDLGSMYNQLSLLQDSNKIEQIGKLFERHTILLSSLGNSINVGFLDKLIELKNFSTTCKELMEYNRKKIIQFKLIEKELYNTRSRYKRYETEEIRIRKIDQKTENALHKSQNGRNNGVTNEINNNNSNKNNENENDSDESRSTRNSDEFSEPPITDEELQSALYSKSCKKTMYGKIPGVNKLNNIILKYVNDPNPDETRRTKFYNLKIRMFQLEKQEQILRNDLKIINRDVMVELESFHVWFKSELSSVTTKYGTFLTEYFGQSLDPWLEIQKDD
ncbi:Atg20 protein [Pichia kluyveri]|uniref:Atg20 protein n=1 Tax=Pichia kluyveri TaxID=36015 RepID=A0AAV5QWV0_PICKL|nr:Atg20 protein [Pichia kluyveri]